MRAMGCRMGVGPADWWWGWRAGGPRGGWRRRRRVWFESGDMKYVILRVLRDRPMHGYEVMKELEEQTRGCYKPSPGTVYPTLQWLEDEGLVESDEVEGKKVYSVTRAGLEFLEANRSTVEDIFDRVEETIEGLLADPMPEVTRLIARIGSHAYRHAWRLRDDAERSKELIAILRRTAEDLENLTAAGGG